MNSRKHLLTCARQLAEARTGPRLMPPAAASPRASTGRWWSPGDLVYTSGHLPVQPSGELVIGRLGADWTCRPATRPPGWRAWASSPRSARSSARSIASAAWSRCWAWSTARPSSPSSRR